MSKTYTQKSNAIRAAKKALEGQSAGTTYEIEGGEGAFTFKLVPPATVEQPSNPAPPVEEKPVATPAPVDAKTGAVIPPMPFDYLPTNIDDIKAALQESVRTEERALIKRLIEDAGIPASEIRGMVEEVAMEHLVRVINEDRQSWFHDFGKRAGLPAPVATAPAAAPKAPKGEKAPKAASTTPAKPQAPADRRKDSEVEGPVKLVWRIADAMLAKIGGNMDNLKRKDVLAECDRQGIAFYTARTQYQRWFSAQKESAKK